jgi:hypothetical protein
MGRQGKEAQETDGSRQRHPPLWALVEERGTQVHFSLSALRNDYFLSDQSAMSRPDEEMNGWISGIRVRKGPLVRHSTTLKHSQSGVVCTYQSAQRILRAVWTFTLGTGRSYFYFYLTAHCCSVFLGIECVHGTVRSSSEVTRPHDSYMLSIMAG